jgi:hypothetical protein
VIVHQVFRRYLVDLTAMWPLRIKAESVAEQVRLDAKAAHKAKPLCRTLHAADRLKVRLPGGLLQGLKPR